VGSKDRDGRTPATATVLIGDMVVIVLLAVVIVGGGWSREVL
jgi:hypothetical protein